MHRQNWVMKEAGGCAGVGMRSERESFMEMRAATVSSLSVLLTSAQYCAAQSSHRVIICYHMKGWEG